MSSSSFRLQFRKKPKYFDTNSTQSLFIHNFGVKLRSRYFVLKDIALVFGGLKVFQHSQEIINLIRHWEPNLGFILLGLPPFTKNLDFAILTWQ